MKVNYSVPTISKERKRMGYEGIQHWEVEAYLKGLEDGGAITAYNIPHPSGKGAQMFSVEIQLSNPEIQAKIDITFREKYGASLISSGFV